MKLSDYISMIGVAVVGTVLAYFLMNSLLGDPKDKTVSFEYLTGVTSSLVDPDSEIFNSAAINPTVEVYVGSCVDLNQDGVISKSELVECGQADPETNTGATSSYDYLEQNNGLSNAENEAINKQNGYASGTTAQQREATEKNIDDNAASSSTTKSCDLNGDGVVSTAEIQACNSDSDRQTTVSGS